VDGGARGGGHGVGTRGRDPHLRLGRIARRECTGGRSRARLRRGHSGERRRVGTHDREGPRRHGRGHRRRGAPTGGPPVHPGGRTLRRCVAVRTAGAPARPRHHRAPVVAGIRERRPGGGRRRRVRASPAGRGHPTGGTRPVPGDPGHADSRTTARPCSSPTRPPSCSSTCRAGYPSTGSRRAPSPCSTTGPRFIRRPG
jgi:hypothetical protein